MNIVIGYILTILGCFGTAGTLFTISNDHRYSYTAPYTSHETTVLTMLVISVIVLVAGIATIIFAIIKNRNENKLKELTNIQTDSQIIGKCPNCNINVSENCSVCPKCGEKLK